MKNTEHIVAQKSKDIMTPKPSIMWYETIDSTNNEALRKILYFDNLSVLAAKIQTAGRGQKGNSWKSGSFENLTFSMVLKFPTQKSTDSSTNTSIDSTRDFTTDDSKNPENFMEKPLLATDQFIISKAATSGIVDYLAGKGIEADIKWPNDIYVNDKKICGILIENSLQGKYVANSVVGIGLNINQREFSSKLKNPTSVSLQTNKEYNLYDEMEELANCIVKRLYDNKESTTEFYSSHLYRLGVQYEYVDLTNGSNFIGTILGVSPSGLLNVQINALLDNFSDRYENSSEALNLSNQITHNDIHRSSLKSSPADLNENKAIDNNKAIDIDIDENNLHEGKDIEVKQYGFKEISYII